MSTGAGVMTAAASTVGGCAEHCLVADDGVIAGSDGFAFAAGVVHVIAAELACTVRAVTTVGACAVHRRSTCPELAIVGPGAAIGVDADRSTLADDGVIAVEPPIVGALAVHRHCAAIATTTAGPVTGVGAVDVHRRSADAGATIVGPADATGDCTVRTQLAAAGTTRPGALAVGVPTVHCCAAAVAIDLDAPGATVGVNAPHAAVAEPHCTMIGSGPGSSSAPTMTTREAVAAT